MEKQFFEAFGIQPNTCTLESLITKGFRSTQPFDDYTKNELALNRIKIIEYFYPPITPKIVLGLINIIINNDKFILDGFNMAKNEQGNYFSTNFKRFCDQKKYYVEKICFNTFNEALFDFCIFYKDAIQDQVRALFND